MLISHLFNVDLYMLKLNISYFSSPALSVLVLRRVVAHRRHTPHHILACSKLLVIFVSQLDHTALPVQFLPNLLIGSHKLVDLSR